MCLSSLGVIASTGKLKQARHEARYLRTSQDLAVCTWHGNKNSNAAKGCILVRAANDLDLRLRSDAAGEWCVGMAESAHLRGHTPKKQQSKQTMKAHYRCQLGHLILSRPKVNNAKAHTSQSTHIPREAPAPAHDQMACA
jgi:hypothetical protein